MGAWLRRSGGWAPAVRQRQGTGVGAGPGPLEVVAAQPAGDVDHLADEIQPGLLRLHRLRRQVAGVDAAQRDLSLFVALGAGGHQFPARQTLGQAGQGLVAAVGDRPLPVGVLGHPGFGQARRHPLRQFVDQQLA